MAYYLYIVLIILLILLVVNWNKMTIFLTTAQNITNKVETGGVLPSCYDLVSCNWTKNVIYMIPFASSIF